ncbi:MAG: hypothetical protein WA188_14460 [Terriglobales bacterium]
MKIILSRKGFDTTKRGKFNYGGPSPILKDEFGRKVLVSLPIPEFEYTKSGIKYGDLRYPCSQYRDMGELIEQWVSRFLDRRSLAHLDPDLDEGMFPRKPGWHGIFGQTGSAQGHLDKHKVGDGSLFLFYGAFRDAQLKQNRLVGVGRMQHVMWGWLYVGQKHLLGKLQPVPKWMAYHPHLTDPNQKNNTIYEAAEAFDEFPGFGVFRTYHEGLRLTAPDRSCSVWKLPRWMAPKDGRTALTYHPNPKAWDVDSDPDSVLLKTKSPGQEYVLDSDYAEEATSWAKEKIRLGLQPNSLAIGV